MFRRREQRIGRLALVDTVFMMLFGLAVIAILIVPFINPPAEEAAAEPIGSLRFEIGWDPAVNVDVDLWVAIPDNEPVGYSYRHSRNANLVRDDRGHFLDPLPVNYENVFVRGAPAGAYSATVFYYADMMTVEEREKLGVSSPAVDVILRVFRYPKVGIEIITEHTVTITPRRREATVARFRVAEDGRVIEGSLNTHPCWLYQYDLEKPRCW